MKNILLRTKITGSRFIISKRLIRNMSFENRSMRFIGEAYSFRSRWAQKQVILKIPFFNQENRLSILRKRMDYKCGV
jgi:hypothetical protein